MKITTHDLVVQTETTAYTNHSEEFLKRYCVDGVMSCEKCPLGTAENDYLCPGGPDEDCIEAIERFLEDCDEEIEEAGRHVYGNDKVIATAKAEAVNHPSHYTSGKIECIDAIECAVDSYDDPKAAFLVGQVIKYLWRAPLKGAYRQDIEKAQWYLNRLVDQFNEKEGE